MAKFLMVAGGHPELRRTTPTFADVPKTHTFYGWIERLYEVGVTSGCSFNAESGERCYCPSANVTRGQLAKFLATTFDL